MNKIWKLAGATEPDVTCLALFGGLTLSLLTFVVVLVDRAKPHFADGVDLSLAALLVFSGALGSFLALRGNTYDDTCTGSWWVKITREGRAAMVILAMTAVISVGKDILGAEHADSHAWELQMNLAENSKREIDAIGARLKAVQTEMGQFIEDNKNSINQAEEARFRNILGEVDSVRTTAVTSSEMLGNQVEVMASKTDGILTRLVATTSDLSTQTGTALSAIELNRTEVRAVAESVTAVDTQLQAYQTASNDAIAKARTSMDSLSGVVGTLQAALNRERALQESINGLTETNGRLEGQVTAIRAELERTQADLAAAQRRLATATPPQQNTDPNPPAQNNGGNQ